MGSYRVLSLVGLNPVIRWDILIVETVKIRYKMLGILSFGVSLGIEFGYPQGNTMYL